MDIHITEHAAIRLRKRVGIRKKSIRAVAIKAFKRGITHAQAKGRLKHYMDKIYLKHHYATNLRVYGMHVYVFQDVRLITVLRLPQVLSKSRNNCIHGNSE